MIIATGYVTSYNRINVSISNKDTTISLKDALKLRYLNTENTEGQDVELSHHNP